jgi:hypothetical protein
MMHRSGISCRENAASCSSAVMPRFKRGIQYSRGVSGKHSRLWNTGSPGQGRAMTVSWLFDIQIRR